MAKSEVEFAVEVRGLRGLHCVLCDIWPLASAALAEKLRPLLPEKYFSVPREVALGVSP